MQTRAPYPSALPEAWAQVLDEVDATLRQAEIAAAQRGQAMSQFAPSPAAEQERLRAWEQARERLARQLEGWPTLLRAAEKEAAEADIVLKAGEETLRRWLSAAEVVRQSLAKWVGPEV